MVVADEKQVGEAAWAAGYGPIRHSPVTRRRVAEMVRVLQEEDVTGDGVLPYELLHGADRVACAAMWLVVHETYSRNVYLDGRPLETEDFKPSPEGHTGGSLNMVPAYTGYMAINALTGITRSWIMGQGHTVAGIDSVNLLLDNMMPAHAGRYSVSNDGLTRYVRDFYSYMMNSEGRQDSPLGSHVNPHTAGSMAEGGYLGFTELQYVHMPLKGEPLVAFLSDGAFEEERGSDWAPRWWRENDSGLVTPIMINNGRRIDQRTTVSQAGGAFWFQRHLRLNSFDPITFDGRDPAAFAWAIFEMERRLQAASQAVRSGADRYPVLLPYGIAVAPKGAGFYNEGTNLAHNLPLMANPHQDPEAAARFNRGAHRLWVPERELEAARGKLQRHARSQRPKERDHPLALRDVRLAATPEPVFRGVSDDRWHAASWTRCSPMDAIDEGFLRAVQANPRLRPRYGNPDEARSNRMLKTVEALKFRVTDPEAGVPEAVEGAIITALNESAVACAALGNKGGINIIVTYEAFGSKMHGVMRQEIIFADHCNGAGRPQRWLSVPLVLTSHTWENGKNELSHQDPSMAGLMMEELAPVSRVLFPADYNTAASVIHGVYQTQGQFWTLVVPKQTSIPDLFTPVEANQLLQDGALRLPWAEHQPYDAKVALVAIGAYQLLEALKAGARLRERGLAYTITYIQEPGRFREPRSPEEQAQRAPEEARRMAVPEWANAVVVWTHTRPNVMLGALRPLLEGMGETDLVLDGRPRRAGILGFINQGGTLETPGMLWVNRCSWVHGVAEAARLLDMPREALLTPAEMQALAGRESPQGVVW